MKITKDQFDNVNIEFKMNIMTRNCFFERGEIVSYKNKCYIGIIDQPGLMKLRYINTGKIKDIIRKVELDSDYDSDCQKALKTIPFQA